MNNFDEWSQIISKFLKAEADLLTSVAKHDMEADSPRSAFIRSVLDLFLPSNYAVGSGRIIDSNGKSSAPIDIVIYRRDFPRLNLPGSADVFIYESVLATIEVRTKLVRNTLFQALDTCVSVADLKSGMNLEVLKKIAANNKLTLNDQNQYVHKHPLLTDRFNLIGRPPSFIYGFNGFKSSPGQLNENIKIWVEQRQKDNLDIDLKSFPAVVATQGCIGWRNAAPLSANSDHLFGIGADAAPIRLIVLQLLYQLNQRLKVTPDSYGLKPSVDAYLDQMAPPDIQYTIGKATHGLNSVPKVEKTYSQAEKEIAPRAAKSQDTKSLPVAKTKPAPLPKPVAKSQPAVKPKPVVESTPAPEPEPLDEPKAAVKVKPAPESKAEVKIKPAPEPKQVAKSAPTTESKPASEDDSAFGFDTVFETMPVANHIPSPEPESDPEAESKPVTNNIPRPALGAMYHEEQTLSGMPIPDAGLIPGEEPEPTKAAPETGSKPNKAAPADQPKQELDFVLVAGPEPEPESDPYIETKQIGPSESKPASATTPEPKASPKPTSGEMIDADPTLSKMSGAGKESVPAPELQAETAKTPVQKTAPEVISSSDSNDPDPYLETMRIPSLETDMKKGEFSQTIPGLQDPPKSIH
jgi:hypothetical protein